jgi:flagellar hook-associated protein 3 FlgL
MRITNSGITRNFIKNISKNQAQVQKYQNQLSSGKEISKPSDNPMLVSKIMNLDNTIKENEQYKETIGAAMDWTNTADGSLSNATDALQRIRELVVQGSTGTLSDSDRSAIAEEVKTLSEQLADDLNTKFDGRYIFGGQKTTDAPFSVNNGVMEYNGDTKDVARQIASNVTVAIPSNGGDITETTGTSSLENEKLGALLNNITKALNNGDTKALSGDLLGDLDKHLDNVVGFRSKMGAVYNRLDAAGQRNETENMNMTELLSSIQDVDIAEKTIEYTNMSSVYQASLSSGAKILQTSLLDYIR